MGEHTIKVLDPTSRPKKEKFKLAMRPTDLTGKKLGIFWNGKPNGDMLLDRFTGMLNERFQLSSITKREKPYASPMMGDAVDDAVVEELVQGCDFLINGVGD